MNYVLDSNIAMKWVLIEVDSGSFWGPFGGSFWGSDPSPSSASDPSASIVALFEASHDQMLGTQAVAATVPRGFPHASVDVGRQTATPHRRSVEV
jgi:hypothetical protein